MAFDEGAGSRNIVDDNIGVVGGLLLQAVAVMSEPEPLQERLPMDSQADARGIAIKPRSFFLLGRLREDLTTGIIRWKEGF
jgi:hypothetical protein